MDLQSLGDMMDRMSVFKTDIAPHEIGGEGR